MNVFNELKESESQPAVNKRETNTADFFWEFPDTASWDSDTD